LAHSSLIQQLNAPEKTARLSALRELKALFDSGALTPPTTGNDVNNHIHTTYSFSPYSPSDAVYTAWISGLATAGLMDHDSVAGAEEFIEAGRILGIATTVGFECRCSMSKTPFAGRKINNPDQDGVVYLAAHGIPRRSIAAAQDWLAPFREKRDIRNRAMTAKLNRIISSTGLELDYDRDIAAISMQWDGGTVTERHILYALSLKMMERFGKGQIIIDLLEEKFGISIAGETRKLLQNPENPMYDYYLLGALKAGMVPRFYINAADECPEVDEFIGFVKGIGAIPAYAYLGDVENSVTGDKRAQSFEDSFLDELVPWLKEAGFDALTYMPTRNTPEQLARIICLCEKHELMQISGEDINSPFQPFCCEALRLPQFRHLADCAWALVGHEMAAEEDIAVGMFSDRTVAKMPGLAQRVGSFAAFGRI